VQYGHGEIASESRSTKYIRRVPKVPSWASNDSQVGSVWVHRGWRGGGNELVY